MTTTDAESIDDVVDILPLAPLQQGILVHSIMAPESAAFHLQMELALEGEVNEASMERAWRLLVERYAALRTSFVWEGVEKPYQLVHLEASLNVVRHDWRHLDRAEQERSRVALIADERARPFDLARPPLIRLATLLLGDRHVRLVWTFHHIVLEGWSAAIVLGDLWKIYGGLTAGQTPDLPPAPSYADFIHWLEAKDLGDAEAYWRNHLKGFGAPIQLEIDRAADDAPPVVTHIEECRRELSRELTTALQDFARTQRVTLNSVVQGAWSILLSRYSGEEDIVYGAALSGRSPELPDVESMVGLFANVLPVRVQVDGNASLIPWLHKLQLDQVTMREYDYSSLMQVQMWAERHGRPLFNAVLLFQNWLGAFPTGQVTPQLSVTMLESQQTGDQPLMLYVTTGEKMLFDIVFDPDRFTRDAVESLLTHCQTLLQGMLEHPNRRIGDIPMIANVERSQVLGTWNATVTDYPIDALMYTAFEQQVDRNPTHRAIIAGHDTLTYGDLDIRANRVAQALRARGIGRGDRVGICLDRNADMLAAVLGVLKAGAAYVPLDPSFPEDRLRFMAEDAELALLITIEALATSFGFARERCLLLDADAALLAAASTARLAPDERAARPEDPAYVIYTSGSTGKPKGVVVHHRAVVNFLLSMAHTPGLAADEVLVAVTTLSFDIAVLELQLPLAQGAVVVIASRDEATSGAALVEVLVRHAATVLQATPASWRMLLEAGWVPRAGFKALVGGEALPADIAAPLLAHGVELWNMYGPTETTVWSTCARITSATDISIGRPIANTTAYVLDAHGQLCPVGVPGELCIGGVGVTLGYWKRPELTAERFVPDPFSTVPEARLYRTGDRARWRADGRLDHLGRLDFQVKVNGYRIELGEIESLLATMPGVSQAVVVVRGAIGSARLVAFIVPESGAPLPDSTELRLELSRHLPDYMVPSMVVEVSALPLTYNGKVDRKALPDPIVHVGAASAELEPPQSGFEATIAAVWQKLLGVAQVSRHDNFFDLGGHSLLAVQAITEIESRIGVRVPIRQLIFESLSTIAASSQVVAPIAEQKESVKAGRGFWSRLLSK